jgi:hypothetical protein
MTAVDSGPLIRSVARDENLTLGLGDEEARMLVEWVVSWAELFVGTAKTVPDAQELVARLSRRGRAIGRFVKLWCEPQGRGAATQLFAAERFAWPLPNRPCEPADLMHHILAWENQHPAD